MEALRRIPSIDLLLRHDKTRPLAEAYGRELVVEAARELLDRVRREVRAGEDPDLEEASLAERLARNLEESLAPGLHRVINATGVVLHTNLGRSPLAREALDAVARTGGGYLDLELDLETGRRGRRAGRLQDHVCALTGAEAALVVNNNAAAVLLLLHTLGRDREVVVSRGELVEIGGSFRIPDVMASSGSRMVEVGTTNRARLADYEAACSENTALLLKVHPSNFRVVGFTREVGLAELAELGRRRGIPVAMDLGSGVLQQPKGLEMEGEPTVTEVLETGVDAITFSGDKALGGPQAGYLVGRSEIVEACRRNPLMRALRPGRLTLAAAEATWRLCRLGRWEELPAWRMLSLGRAELEARATAWRDRLAKEAPRLEVELREGTGRVGGGTAPGETLPSVLLSVDVEGLEAGAAAARLRRRDPPVLARVQEGRLLLDPRTVLPGEEDDLLAAVVSLGSS